MGRRSDKWLASRIVRHLAGAIAFVFAFVSVVVSQHSHGKPAFPVAAGVFLLHTTAMETVEDTPITGHNNCDAISASRCASCDWLAMGITLSPTATDVPLVSFSRIAAVLLRVRRDALYDAPTLLRGLRGPPTPVSFA